MGPQQVAYRKDGEVVQRPTLPLEVAFEYRKDHFALTDNAFTIIDIASSFPDEQYIQDESALSLNESTNAITIEYIKRAMQSSTKVIALYVISELSPRQEQIIDCLALGMGLFQCPEEAASALKAIFKKGLILHNSYLLKDCEGTASLFAHEEFHKLYYQLSQEDLLIMKLGYYEVKQTLSAMSLPFDREVSEFENYFELLSAIDPETMSSPEEFWAQLYSGYGIPEFKERPGLCESSLVESPDQFIRNTTLTNMANDNKIFNTANSIARRLSLLADEQGVLDDLCLTEDIDESAVQIIIKESA